MNTVSATAKAVMIEYLNRMAASHRATMKQAGDVIAANAFAWWHEQAQGPDDFLSFGFDGKSFMFNFTMPTTEPGMLRYSSIGVYFSGPANFRAIPCPNSLRAKEMIERMMADKDLWPGVIQAAEMCGPEYAAYFAYTTAVEELEKSMVE